MDIIKRTVGALWCGWIFGIAGLLVAGDASAQLSVTPITWDVVGLDSNRPLTSGPELFPVGAEVCSAVDTTNVTVDLVWPDGNGNGWDLGPGDPHINLRPGSLTSLNFAAIGAGECVDAYFELQLTRSAAAFGQSREYVIQAGDGVATGSTPSPRQIVIEYLVSQSRNTTEQIRWGQQADQSDWQILGAGGTINLAINESYFFELTTATSTAYEELESFITLSNTIFQVVSVSTTYSQLTAPPSRVPVPNPSLWADGCLWDSDPNSPNYLSCLADGKAGGTVVTVYEIKIISTGGDTVGLEALIYDRSGGSYHYNTDFSESPGSMNTYDPTDSSISKRFIPDTIGIGGTSRLRFTISNPNPIEISDYNFIDDLPAGLEVASVPNAATTCGGIWNPLAGETSLAFDGGTISANGSCTLLVDVMAAAAGTYDNTSNNLFIGGFDTGDNATATLVVSATPPPVLTCNDLAELALWRFPTGASATAPAPSVSLVAASAAAGAGLTPTIETATADVGTASWSSDYISPGALVLGNDQYFEFVVDTAGLDEITLDFSARRTSQGAQSIQLYYGPTTGVETAGPVYSIGSSATWIAFGPTTITTGLNPAGTTRFRFYVYNSGQNNNGHAVFLDLVRFRGLYCTEVPPPPPVPGIDPPTISKTFTPNPIGVGGESTLTFTITNPNPTDPLTGITVRDQLPASLAIVAGTFGGTCVGFWDVDPGDGVTLLHSDGLLAGGASCTLTVDVTASAVGSMLNISDAIYAAESGYNTDLVTGVAQATLGVLAPPTITKDFDPNLVLLGVTPGDASVLSFTITNPNPGTGIVGVAFSDTFPAGLVVATPANGSSTCAGTLTAVPGAGSVSFSGGAISSGGTCTVTVDVTGPAGSYPNTSSPVSHVVGGVTASNGLTASDTVVIDQPIPGLSFVKEIGTGSDPDGAWSDYLAVTAGDQVWYKLTVENTGEVPLTGIAVSDPMLDLTGCTWPATLPVAGPGDPPPHIAVCVVGPVTTVAGARTNTASAVSTEVPGPTTDTATYATAEIDLAKVASPLTFTAAGQVITYTFTVTNTGSAILAGPVSITDPLVPGASCPSLTTIGNNDNFFDPAEVLVCTGIYTTQPSDVTNLGVTNTAFASAGGFDSPPDSATVTVPVAEPTIAKSFATDPIPVGTAIALTVTVTNNAVVPLTGVGFTDTLPAGLSFAASATSNNCGGTVTVNAGLDTLTLTGGSLPAGAGCSVIIDVTGDVAGSYTNTTSVVGSDQVVGTTTGSDTLDVVVPNVSADKADTLVVDNDGDGVADPGDVLRYAVVVSNAGTTAATNVAFADTPDANTALVVGSVTTTQGSVTVGNTAGDTTVGVSIGTLAAAGSVTITFDVTVDSPFPAGTTTVANQGLVTGDGGISVPTDDPGTGTPNDPTVTPVEDPGVEADKTDVLAIDADGDGVPSPGDTLEYTVVITNTGNVDLTGVTFTDTPDANTALVVGSVATTQGTVTTGNTAGDVSVGVDVGTVSVSGTATITFRVTIDNPLPVGVTSVSNQGTVTTNETPDEPTNDPDTLPDDDPTSTTVTAEPVLQADKADALFVDADGNGIPSPGDTLRYTVVITNSGNTAATGVFFTDPIPAYTTVVAGSVATTQGTVNSEDPVDVTIGDIAAGSTVTITFDVLVDNPLPGGVTQVANQGTVSAGNHPDEPTNDPDTAPDDDPTVTPMTAEPVIEADKTDTLFDDADGSGDVSPGDTLSYSVTISNTGNTDATGVVFTDPIPAYTTVVAGSVATSQGTVNSEDPVDVSIGTIGAGSTVTISFHVVIDNPLAVGVTEISNQGVVSSNEVPDEPTNDPDTVPDDDPTNTPVNAAPDLSITKDDGGITTVPGGVIAFTLSYANTGNQNATGVVLTDTVPAGTTFNAGASTPGWVCVPGTGAGSVCTLPIGALAAGAAGSAIFAVTVDNPVPPGFTLVANTATVADDGTNGPDPTPGDNTSSDTTPVIGPSNPSIDALKEVEIVSDLNGNQLADPGDVLRYTVTVINDGDTVIENAVLQDTPDPVTTLVAGSVTTTAGTVTVGNGSGDTMVEVAFGDFAVGQIEVVVFDVLVNHNIPSGVTQISNQGIVLSDTIPGEPTNDPNTDPDDDPTVIRLGDQTNQIPDLGLIGRLLLILGLAAIGAFVIRQRTF